MMALYDCTKEGWEKFTKEMFVVEKGGLWPERELIDEFLDLNHFKTEGRNELIKFLADEGYLRKFFVVMT
jgi:hypothetical protein